MNRVLIFSVILFAAAIALYYYQDSVRQQQIEVAGAEGEQRPDFTAKTLRSRSYDENGLLAHQIWASDMAHFSNNEFTSFKSPKVVVYPNGKQAGWTLNAEQGRLRENQLILEQQVVIETQTEQNQTNTLLTEYVEMDLASNEVSSDQPVTVKGPSYQLQGVGLRGNVEKEQIELLSDVKATYEPEK
ncbi:LPS export ABC transporter periplasmic protein LptC [Corallincola platygyrae]|uniref:Lipopolysaccharide export system protein LptC n=1 Tax=Corallincola platygyrae TaxID=1193278 RepID=A0ABW4XPK4_9GAMM